jgi:hypothetical protein
VGAFLLLVVVHLVVALLYVVLGTLGGGENVFGTLVRFVRWTLVLGGGAFGFVYTHDEAVRARPALGRAVLFRGEPTSTAE